MRRGVGLRAALARREGSGRHREADEQTDPLLRHLRPAGDRHADHRRDRAGRAEGLRSTMGAGPPCGEPPSALYAWVAAYTLRYGWAEPSQPCHAVIDLYLPSS